MIHTSIANVKPNKTDGKYITSEFIGLTKYYIFQELFSIKQEHGPNFGDMVICLDKSENGYWRKDVYPMYKASRKKGRDASDIDYDKVFASVNEVIEQIKNNLPWKVVEVPRAEADDIMLVLSREFNKSEKILIHSPDKDMIQAQMDTDKVYQYSSLTKKWIVPENKHESMDHWINEHICLGDPGDEVPKVVDHTEFSETFLDHLNENNITAKSPIELQSSELSEDQKNAIRSFDIYKLNRKGESTGELDIYKDIKFGPSTLQKKIAEFGSLNNWLNSHPLYRKHYERNRKLVLEEGIPSDIRQEVIIRFKEAETDLKISEFEKYLIQSDLKSILLDLPSVFKVKRELTAEDFGW